ncbi:hypothetical protein SLA2020_224970 [Shorea laevis]
MNKLTPELPHTIHERNHSDSTDSTFGPNSENQQEKKTCESLGGSYRMSRKKGSKFHAPCNLRAKRKRKFQIKRGWSAENQTVEGGMAAVLAPSNAAGRVEVLTDEVAAFLEVVDSFDAVAPLDFLSEDLGLLYIDPLLANDVLPHLQHGHRVLVRVRRIEVRRGLIELNDSLLPPHFLPANQRVSVCSGALGLFAFGRETEKQLSDFGFWCLGL